MMCACMYIYIYIERERYREREIEREREMYHVWRERERCTACMQTCRLLSMQALIRRMHMMCCCCNAMCCGVRLCCDSLVLGPCPGPGLVLSCVGWDGMGQDEITIRILYHGITH